jgi:Acyltransferase family
MTKTSNENASAHPETLLWYHGFDWLRTIFICFVLLMHLNFTQIASGTVTEVTVFDVLQYNILCLAVPGFLLISSYLLVTHCHSWPAYWKKIKGMVALYLFWVGAWILVTKPTPEMTLGGIAEFFLRGGGWAYYFFAVLVINSILTALIHRCSSKLIWLGFVMSVILSQGVFHAMAFQSHAWTHIPTYWWPICFFPIPFVAMIASHYHAAIAENYQRWCSAVIALAVVACGFAIIEWQFCADAGLSKMRMFLPEYLRASMVIGSALLLFLAMRLNYSPWVVKWISKNSLGIFCLHVFMLGAVATKVRGKLPNHAVATVVTVVIVIAVCGISSEVLRRLLKERII